MIQLEKYFIKYNIRYPCSGDNNSPLMFFHIIVNAVKFVSGYLCFHNSIDSPHLSIAKLCCKFNRLRYIIRLLRCIVYMFGYFPLKQENGV